MIVDGCRRCCRGWIIIHYISRQTAVWSVFVIAVLSTFVIEVKSVHSTDVVVNRIGYDTRQRQQQEKATKSSAVNNIFKRTPNGFIKNDAEILTSLPISTEQETILASSRIGNSKAGMKIGGSKCKYPKGKMKTKGKNSVDDDGNNDYSTSCSPSPSTISPSLLSSTTITPSTVETTTATPFPVTTTSLPTVSLPTDQTIAPSTDTKGKSMSKSKTSPISAPAPVILTPSLATNHPSTFGKGKGKMSPQEQVPVYSRCSDNNSPDTTAPNSTPLIPPSISASPISPPTFVSSAPTIAVTTPAPLIPPSISASPVVPPMTLTSDPIATPTTAPLTMPLTASTPIATTATPVLPPAPTPMLRFEFTLDFDEATVPTSDQADYVAAAQRWEQVIIGDVQDIPIQEFGGSQPDVAGCRYPTDTGFIDDLYMCIYYEPLSDGIIGQGGYIHARTNGIPVSGFARIDPDEIAAARQLGYFNDLILHEFGHALGIGTTGACPSDSMSSMANIEYQRISQCNTPIPIDRPGCFHYDEDCLVTELMTPVVTVGDSPLSRITVGWANDIGYEVNYDAADPFDSSQLGTVAGCNCNRRLSTTTNIVPSNRSNVRYLGHQQSMRNNSAASNRKMQQQQIPVLSVDGYKIAIESGLTHLYGQKLKRNIVVGRGDDQQQGNQSINLTATKAPSSDSNLNYVGDQFVWVYVRENDHVYSVLVKP